MVFTYPFSRSLWLAIGLLFRPPEARDFAPEAEPIELTERRRAGSAAFPADRDPLRP